MHMNLSPTHWSEQTDACRSRLSVTCTHAQHMHAAALLRVLPFNSLGPLIVFTGKFSPSAGGRFSCCLPRLSNDQFH